MCRCVLNFVLSSVDGVDMTLAENQLDLPATSVSGIEEGKSFWTDVVRLGRQWAPCFFVVIIMLPVGRHRRWYTVHCLEGGVYLRWY